MDELLRDFVSETTERLDALDGELDRIGEATTSAGPQRLLRVVHAIKGACGFLPVPRIEALAHAAETFLAAAPRDASALAGARATLTRIRAILVEIGRNGAEPDGDDRDLLSVAASLGKGAARPPAAGDDPPTAPATMRVEIASIARLAVLAAELIASRDELFAIARKHGDPSFEPALQRLANLTAELQGGIAAARVQSLASALRHLPRLAAALARDAGKEVRLTMTGTDAALDRALVEPVRTSVDQLVRNAIHHGIEQPAVRTAAGKPAAGTLALAAERHDGRLALTLSDDGAGLDLGALRKKAIAAGLLSETDPFTAEEAARLVFAPGLSSAESPTRLAGRGIGLDLVKSGLAAVGGKVALTSTPGQGTAITLDIPAPADIAAREPAAAPAPTVEAAPPAAPPPAAAAQRRILLVDDSPFFRSMLTPVLERAGYEVVACASPADALEAARSSQRGFDVVVSDIDMPGLDAPAFAETIRADNETPIIALASDRTRAGGFTRIVTKFDREGLVAALEDMGKSAA